MKRILMLMAGVAVFFSCQRKAQDSKQEVAEAKVEVSQSEEKVYKLEDLAAKFEELVDQEVYFTGNVTHVCKHSGKRAFIESDGGKTKIRVEAKGKIKGFGGELIGSELLLKGKVREFRIDEEYLAKWEAQEKKLKEKKGKTKEALKKVDEASCQSGNSKIDKLRAEIKENGKGYKSIYFIDGLEYSVKDGE